MPRELSREIRKLEVRTDNFLRKEEAFTKELERCINRFKEMNKNLEDARKEVSNMSSIAPAESMIAPN